MKSRLSQLLLTLFGYNVDLVYGYYRPPQLERWVLHVWIRVNGVEYDAVSGHCIDDNQGQYAYTNPDPNDEGLKMHDWDTVIPEQTRY